MIWRHIAIARLLPLCKRPVVETLHQPEKAAVRESDEKNK